MVGGMTIPLQVSESELSRFKGDKFGVSAYRGLLSLLSLMSLMSLTGARQWGPMVRLELS